MPDTSSVLAKSGTTVEAGPNADLVEAVARTFRANGYHGTTMSLISKRTGLGRSSLYHHFGRGKLEMAQRSLDQIDAFIGVIFAEVTAPKVSPPRKWETIEKMLRKHYQNGQLGCLLAVFALEDVPRELRARTKELFDRWIEAIANLYKASGIAGNDADRSARRDIAAIQGALILARAQTSNDPFDQAMREISTTLCDLSEA